MSRERHDTLVDELERELQQALALEPSPDFMRQVRARIEQRSQRRVSVLPWQMMAVAAAVVCVAAIGFAWRMTRNPSQVPVVPASTLAGVDVTLAFEQPTPGNEPRQPSRAPRSRRPDRSAAVAEPEIIVPADRARALTRFLELARTRAVDEETLRPVAAASPSGALDIKPLIVSPLSIPEIELQGGASPDGTDRE